MKKFLFTLLAVISTLAITAQNELVATLTHGQVTTSYYGQNAFISALDKAADGDIINLSVGTFTAPNIITKAVTIQGAGMLGGSEEVTALNGSFTVNTIADEAYRFSMEGIYSNNNIYLQNATNPYFVKCFLNRLQNNEPCDVTNALLVNCAVYYLCINYTFDVTCINSYINEYVNSFSTGHSFGYFQNCVLSGQGYDNTYYQHTSFYNSIVAAESSYDVYVPPTTAAYHTLFFNVYSNYKTVFLTNVVGRDTDWTLSGNQFSNLFKTYRGARDITKDEDFSLLPKIAMQYIGTDSTQIGMQGGPYPYDILPTYPRITKFDVAPNVDENGQLRVDIEVTNAR